ncbi:hypothetical protein BC835DRAFT_1302586 [Cytidiella melzeri]|nr:hypothetical protein BC835DRAFT_1302586 [Cytidiella melzeri]
MSESESIQEASVETAAVETAAAAANANADIFPNWRSFKIKNQSSTRSACPHYKGVPPDGAGGSDSDQNMDADAIKYLQGKSVKFIISANANQLSKAQQDALTKAGIGYKWLPVPDFQAPKKADFDACYAAYTAHTSGVHFYSRRSRVWRWLRDTRRQTRVAEMVCEGEITDDEGRKCILTQKLGYMIQDVYGTLAVGLMGNLSVSITQIIPSSSSQLVHL